MAWEIGGGDKDWRPVASTPALAQVNYVFLQRTHEFDNKDLRIEVVGESNVATRACTVVRVACPQNLQYKPAMFLRETDEYDFHVDREFGILMSYEGRRGEQLIERSEIQSISFNEQFHEYTFEPRLLD